MKQYTSYLSGIVITPILIAGVFVANELFFQKTEYDCQWCNFTTRTIDDGLITNRTIVAESRFIKHERENHHNIIREFRKLQKDGVEWHKARQQAIKNVPHETEYE